jgi:ATP-dependent RNA/DNA helicase IGHMBP2
MQAYFQQLKELLTIEQQTDRAQYQQILEQKSVHARREAGVCWYPIIIKGSEVTYGDYINIEIERPSDYVDTHQLRTGMPAVLFSQHNPKEDRAEGVIAFLRGNKMKLSTKLDELPNWIKNGKLGVDMLFDDNSYTEMFNALKNADDITEKNKSELHNVLSNKKQADFNSYITPVLPHQHLNVFQKEAVQKIVQATQLAIVHGPPGTGKTTTLVASILELLKHNNPKILVCAPSNVAVDLLTEKLAEQKVNVVRIGNPVRVSENVLKHALDHKIAEHTSVKQIKQLRKQSAEYIDMAHKYKRNFGKAEREQRKALFDEAHKIVKEIQALEDYISQDVFNKAQVITSTLVGANHYTLKNTEFDIAIIDEAAQALEPSCWIAINKSKKLILAGDHCQLPPTIKSDEAMRKGLANTLMEKLIASQAASVILLQEQYRMHEAIMEFPSQQLYNGKLIAHASNKAHKVFTTDAPLQFVDTAGCGFEELVEDTAIGNEEEAQLLLKHLLHYCTQLKEQNKEASIGIVSPYKRQVLTLQAQIAEHSELQALAPNITVNTIDSFQGQEKDIIYISLVRSNDSSTIGFLSDTRRMNVAITRARKKLVIIGDSATIGNHPFYQSFIEYAQSIDSYASAWEWLY